MKGGSMDWNAVAISTQVLKCSWCGEIITECEGCEKPFVKDDAICCIERLDISCDDHLCVKCGEKKEGKP